MNTVHVQLQEAFVHWLAASVGRARVLTGVCINALGFALLLVQWV